MSIFLFFALLVGLLYVPWFLYTREKFSDSDKTTVRHLAFGLAKLNSTVDPIIHISRKTISGDVHYIPVEKRFRRSRRNRDEVVYIKTQCSETLSFARNGRNGVELQSVQVVITTLLRECHMQLSNQHHHANCYRWYATKY